MTAPRDPDRLIRAFLEEGKTELPDRAYDAVRAHVDRTRQRAVIGPWRNLRMSFQVRVAIAAVAVVVLAVIGINLLPGPISGPGASPTPTAEPSPGPSPTPTVRAWSATGPLEPGTYDMSPDGAVIPMPVTFTVPAGWYNEGWAITKNETYISFWSVTNTYRDPCHWSTTALDPTLGPSGQDLIDALRDQAGRDATLPVATTIDGRPAQRVELEWPEVDLGSCDDGEYRLFVFGADGSRGNTIGFHDLIWILDVDGFRVVIEATERPDITDALGSETQSIIDSIRFGLPAAPVTIGSCTLTLTELEQPDDPGSAGTALSPPYAVTMRVRTDAPPAADVVAEGSGWGEDGPGRAAVSLIQPDGVAVFPGVGLAGGVLTTNYALDSPGTWHLAVRADAVGCLALIPIEAQAASG
jgi:hypothetical protein